MLGNAPPPSAEEPGETTAAHEKQKEATLAGAPLCT